MKYNNTKQKFSVRKLTVGTASVFLGATVVPSLVDLPQELVSVAKASEESDVSDTSVKPEHSDTENSVDKSNLYNLLEEARKNKNYDYEIFKFASEELKNEYWDIERRFNNNDNKTIEIINSNKYSEQEVREQEAILREISNDFIKVKEKIYNYVENSELTLYKKAAVEEINSYIDKIDKEIEEIHNITNFTPIEKMVSIDFSSMKSVTNKEEVNKIKKEKIEEINREKNKVLNRKEIENYLTSKEELKNIKYVDYEISGIDNIYDENDKQNIKNVIDNKLSEIINSEKVYEKYNSINRKLGYENERTNVYINFYDKIVKENHKPNISIASKDKLFYENNIYPRNKNYNYKTKAKEIINNNDFYNNRGNTEVINKIVSELDLYDRRLDAILNLEDRIREDIIAPYNELPENEKIENKGNTETAINLKQKISELANKLYDKLDNTNLDNQEEVEKLKAEIRAGHLNVEKYVANALISNEKYALNKLRAIRSSRTELDYNKPLGNDNYALKDEFNTDEIVTSAQESINNATNEEEIKAIKDTAIAKIKEKNLNLYRHRAINQIEKDLLNIKKDINNLQQISPIEKQKYKDVLDEMLDNYKKKIMASSSPDYHHKMVSFVSNNLRNSYIEIIKDYLEKEIKNEPNVTNKTSESVDYYNKKLSSAKNKLEEISTFIKAKKNNVKEEPDLAFKYDKNYDVHKTFDNSHHYTEIIKEAIEEKIVLETAKLMLEELPNTDSNSSNLNVTTNTSINVNPRLEVDKNNNANNTTNNITENSNNIDDKVNANNELNSNNTSENNNINVPNNNSNNVLNSASDNISNNNNSNNINQKDKNINSNNSEVPKGINLNNNISNINSNNNLSTNKDSVSIKNNSTKEINANNLETNNKQSSVSINSNNELKTDRAKTDKKIDSNYNYSEQKINNKLLPNTGLNNTNSNYMAVATILASIYLAARKQKSNK